MRIYVDMDSVLCDFQASYQAKLLADPAQIYPQSQYGFFANLAPIEGAIESFKELYERFDVYILTRPSFHNPLCYTEKRVWVEKYFGFEVCRKLILCGDKWLLKGDILIDDYPYVQFEGKLIQFATEEFPDWTTVMKYFEGK